MVNGVYALATLVLFIVQMKVVVYRLFSTQDPAVTGEVYSPLAFSAIWLFILVRTAQGFLDPGRSHLFILRKLGRICQFAWLAFALFAALALTTTVFKISAYNLWQLFLGSLVVTGYGAYTLKILREVEEQDRTKKHEPTFS